MDESLKLSPIVGAGTIGLMVWGFYGDSFTSTCASMDSCSLMGGEYCCDVCPFVLTCTTYGRGPRCGMLVGNFVKYILLYIMVVMGASLMLLFNGPTSYNVAGYISG